MDYKTKMERAPYKTWTHNGLDFSRARQNPNSRLAKIVNYLRAHGMSTKREISYHVFAEVLKKYNGSEFPRNHGTYVWNLGARTKILVKVRIGNTVLWSLGPNAGDVV